MYCKSMKQEQFARQQSMELQYRVVFLCYRASESYWIFAVQTDFAGENFSAVYRGHHIQQISHDKVSRKAIYLSAGEVEGPTIKRALDHAIFCNPRDA